MKPSTSIVQCFIVSLFLTFSLPTFATTVQFQTSLGDIEVNLYDQSTPLTVANFLQYVNEAIYTDSVIHRIVPGFVVQGGGFTLVNNTLSPLTNLGTVLNEPVFSSVRGTIAMAKIGGDPNSASNQWFFNLADNSNNLDAQNGGFTVFGEVTGDGLAIVSAIENSSENTVTISGVVVLDAAVDTAAGLSPPPNVIIDANPATPGQDSGSSGGGGGLGLMVLLLLGLGRFIGIKQRNELH